MLFGAETLAFGERDGVEFWLGPWSLPRVGVGPGRMPPVPIGVDGGGATAWGVSPDGAASDAGAGMGAARGWLNEGLGGAGVGLGSAAAFCGAVALGSVFGGAGAGLGSAGLGGACSLT